MIYSLVGFLAVFLILVGMGITRGRWMREYVWFALWLCFSTVFAFFLLFSLLNNVTSHEGVTLWTMM